MANELLLPHLEDLSPSQLAFLLQWEESPYRAFFGGRQSGKTDVGIDDDLLNSMFRYPGEQGAIFVPDYPRSVEIRERILKYVPPGLRKWNGSDKIWRFRCPNDPETWSPVVMRSLNEEDAPRSFTFRWAHFDEVALIKEAAYRNALACMATTGGDEKPGPHTCTTTHKGMGFIWRDFIQNPTEDHWHVECESRENPAFPDAYFHQLAEKHGYDSPFFKQEYRGMASAFVGQAIPQFDRTKHADRKIPFNEDWQVYRGWDFGWTAPTVCVWAQIDAEETVVLKGCRTWTETPRVLVLSQLSLNGIKPNMPRADMIDPSGAAPRAAEGGDRGWRDAMEEKSFDVRWTRRVSETRRLNLMRQWAQANKLLIDKDCEGYELLVNAFETGELSDNLEKDELKDQHPQADILDAVGYIFANLFGNRPEPKVSVI